ncbi:MAG: hypothetical protein ACLU0O_02010 [Collinsella sp.]
MALAARICLPSNTYIERAIKTFRKTTRARPKAVNRRRTAPLQQVSNATKSKLAQTDPLYERTPQKELNRFN